nr:hypothetical protein GTC16762_07880 [Pigmentibacter ruber]
MLIKYVYHRVNKAEDIKKINPSWGVEIDLRSNVKKNGTLHLSHDPWTEGDDFEDWLKIFVNHRIEGPIILNTKEDGLESRVIELLDYYKIENWFFLDTAFPTLVKYTLHKNETRFAIRYSCYEPIESLIPFIGKAQWVWVDCFGGLPVDHDIIKNISKNFKICLVSPELVGKNITDINNFFNLSKYAKLVCTKDPNFWMSNINYFS